jgi:Domain of unknown function (DUF305)
MRSTALTLVGAVAVAGTLAAYPPASGQGGAGEHAHPPVGTRPADASSPKAEFSRGLRAAMSRMHEDMLHTPPTADADRDFLALMIPHHEGAVEMARLLLVFGQDPLVRRLAEEIIASQQAEIVAMKARLEILSHGAEPNPGGFPALGGTRGQ